MKQQNVIIPENLADYSSEINDYLNGYDQAVSIHDGDYTASWLLSDIHDHRWLLRTRKTIKNLNEERERTGNLYKYTASVYWDRLLPDGSLLTDDKNDNFLNLLQKLFFVVILDPVDHKRMATESILNMHSRLMIFVSWLFLHKVRFEPLTYGLSRVSNSDLTQHVKELINGGSFEALRIGQRVLSKAGITLDEHRNCCDLNTREKERFVSYLTKHELFVLNKHGQKVVERALFREHFIIPKQDLTSHRASAFLRQFEPELLAINPEVLVPLNLRTDYPSHRTPLIKDVINKTYSYHYSGLILHFIRKSLIAEPLFPGFLGTADRFKLFKVESGLKSIASSPQKTPWIPLEDNLKLINTSIRLVTMHSDEILDLYVDVFENLDKNGHLDRENNYNYKKTLTLLNCLSKSLKDEFNIVSFSNSDEEYYDDKSGGISFATLIELLTAACLILIAGLKPVRIEELSELPYKCLYFKEGDGYWLSQKLMKSGTDDILPDTAKPIPQITAKGIKCLRRLNDLAKRFARKAKQTETDYLLYRIPVGSRNRFASIMDRDAIGGVLEKLCDFAELSIDEHGRRWYVNVHELRKSFLLTFFWTFKHSSLDACQWIAGHKDPDHVHQYIESNYPGEEMAEIGAEYARQQLTYFHEKSSFLEMKNTEELYIEVCKHFNVEDYTSVDENELQNYLELALLKGNYDIDMFDIGESNGLIDTATVAFKVVKNEGN